MGHTFTKDSHFSLISFQRTFYWCFCKRFRFPLKEIQSAFLKKPQLLTEVFFWKGIFSQCSLISGKFNIFKLMLFKLSTGS